MFCSNCGAENKENAKYCFACGTQLVRLNEVTESQINESVNSSANASAKSQAATQVARMPRKKFYHHPQNEKMCKFIQISAKALYIIVFVMYFANLAHVSTQRDLIGVELQLTGKIMSLAGFKTMLLVFCVIQELLVLFAHIEQNYICALVLIATMLVHSVLIGAGIMSIIWFAGAGFFAFWLYKFDKRYRTYCQTGEI